MYFILGIYFTKKCAVENRVFVEKIQLVLEELFKYSKRENQMIQKFLVFVKYNQKCI